MSNVASVGEAPALTVGAGVVARRWWLRRLRGGLRARTTAAFALGALGLSLLLSLLTYQITRSYFLTQRRESAVTQAFANARQVRVELVRTGGDAAAAVIVLPVSRESRSYLRLQGKWFSNTVGAGGPRPPASLQRLVAGGAPGRQRMRVPQGAALAVGIPLSADAAYFELVSESDIERNLSSLATALAVAATLTTLGGAVLGRVVSARVVRPLRDAAGAATEIAQGRLDTRLELAGDADLDPLVVSFNDMVATLQHRLEREARFASDVSHELRTPLTALATASQLMKSRRDELSERSQTALDVLVSQVEHFERLVLDLLEITRFDAGAAELYLEDTDLAELVPQIVQSSAPGVQVDLERLGRRVVGADKRRIERILANLLQNALLYAGGATRVVVEDVGGRPAVVRIAVEDAGPGVPDDEKARIFERFTRGRSHLRGGAGPKGTGLGLSLVAEHARLHGGRVWVEDRPTGGARFVVELLVERREAAPADDRGDDGDEGGYVDDAFLADEMATDDGADDGAVAHPVPPGRVRADGAGRDAVPLARADLDPGALR